MLAELVIGLLSFSIPSPLISKPVPEVSVPVVIQQPVPVPEKPVIDTPKPVKPAVARPAVAYTTEPALMRINQSRERAGLRKLKRVSKLDTSASRKCQHMSDNDYWAHDAPDGTKWHSFITGYGLKGEILAEGYGGDSDAQHQAWLNSPTHKEVLMSSDYSSFGVGYCTFKSGINLTVVHFGG